MGRRGRERLAAPGYSFEGYNVYQGATIAGPWKLVAVYDSANGVREVFDKKLDETNCEILLSAVVAHGADNGIRDFTSPPRTASTGRRSRTRPTTTSR